VDVGAGEVALGALGAVRPANYVRLLQRGRAQVELD
jgi:hypothetical protein